MRSSILEVGACILVLAGVLAAQVADSPEATLERARQLVEQKLYNQALEEYEKIAAWLWHDPDLVIEQARVYGYADRHAEAIALFEEVRSKHPDGADEFLRELGDQYLWNSQRTKAIDVYHQALSLNPEDVGAHLGLARALAWDGRHAEALAEYDAILSQHPAHVGALTGKADVLSWQDRLEEAYQLYEKALEKDPGNLDARNGRARVRVWQGYHRVGAGLYRGILQEHPENPDALEGLAFALHWDGRDGPASDTLRRLLGLRPDRTEASKLSYQIQNSQNPYVTQYNRYSDDKNDLSIQTHGLRAGLHLDYDTRLEGIYEWQRFQQPSEDGVQAHRGGLGFGQRLGEQLELNSYLYVTEFVPTDWTPFTTSTWITWRPDDIWRLDVSYNRETFEDIGSVRNEVIVNGWSGSVDLRPNRFLFFSGKFKQGWYSDGNQQESVLTKAELRLLRKPYVKLYYNYYFSTWEELLQSGYFNPRQVHSHTLGIYASREVNKKLFLEGQASVGYESQQPTANAPTFYAAAGLVYRCTENWQLALRGEHFNVEPDDNSDGYRRTAVTLTLTYNFGAEAPRPMGAAQPFRPAGGR